MILENLKSFDAQRYSVEELVALHVQAKFLMAAFAEFELEAPAWLIENSEAITKEVKVRSNDQLEKELKETEARLDALKSADERRSELRDKAQRLKTKLGK